MSVVQVQYQEGSSYGTFYSYFSRGLNLSLGDKVIVPVGNGDVPKLATVRAVLPQGDKSATKAVIQKLDFTDYTEFNRSLNRKKEIEKELAKRDRALSARQRYQRLAESDSEAANLLRELEALG